MGSFEKKPNSIETEADSYEMEVNFTPEELQNKVKAVEIFAIWYLISKDCHTFYLSLEGHRPLLKKLGRNDLVGGTIIVDHKLNIEEINREIGSLDAGEASPKDFPLVRRIVQKYLDNIRENLNPK